MRLIWTPAPRPDPSSDTERIIGSPPSSARLGIGRPAGLESDELNLRKGNLAGDHATTLRVVGLLPLKSVDLSYNHLNEEAALAIVRAVKPRDKMTSLGLASCKIGPTGAKEIAEYLKVSAALTTLNLCNNDIPAEGAKAIAEALKVNNSITSIRCAMTYPI